MFTFTHIHYHKVDKYQNQYAVLTLNRPQKAHAYNRAMLCEIEAHLHDIQKKTNVCALVIQSEGHRIFCAGADLEEMKTATALTALHLQSEAVFSLLESLSCVTIASVHGPAIAGGFEMVLACDLRLISSETSFSLPEVSLGLIPAAGGCVRLPNLIGSTRAKGVILGGQVISAAQSLEWGLVNQITEKTHEVSLTWAQKIATYDSVALRFAKQVLNSTATNKKAPLLQAKALEGILYHRRQ